MIITEVIKALFLTDESLNFYNMKKILIIISVSLIVGTSCKKVNSPADPAYETQKEIDSKQTCASAEILADELQKDPNRAL